MKMNDHCERILQVISKGIYRTSQIEKTTCLGPNQVSAALRQLRKNKLVRKINGEHRLIEDKSNDQI